MTIGRNDPCHCGSGKKYKKCCSAKDDAARSTDLAQAALRGAVESGGAVAPAQAQKTSGQRPAGAGGLAPRPKSPPPRSPTQLRKRAV
jgi:hypothetical protein